MFLVINHFITVFVYGCVSIRRRQEFIKTVREINWRQMKKEAE